MTLSTLNSIEAEYLDIVERKAWLLVFQEIREKCEREAKDKIFTFNESGKSENRSLNRYRDVNPYDHSRIIIHRGKINYINANLVKMERADRKYILTQGPLKETVGHFWLMIWEQNTKAILMLNKLIEKKQIKCHMYWPENIGEKHILNLQDVGLTVEYLKCEEYTHFSKRTFRLTDIESRKSREIIQFHYTTWPDFGIPSSPVTFLQFLKQVRDSGALEPDVGPAVVHCSAGIGRSGTFCLVDCCLVLFKKGETKLSVREILYELRRYRMGLIQTADQLYFSYQAIIEGMKLLEDPSFMDYEEVPIIPTNDNSSYIEDMQSPPPPPPTRIESLRQQLPPPLIRSSISLGVIKNNNSDDIMTTTEQYKNDKNNSNLTSTIQYESDRNSINGRPLPPLPPRPNILNEVKESDSDDNDDFFTLLKEYDSEDNDIDDDDDNGEESPMYERKSDINDDVNNIDYNENNGDNDKRSNSTTKYIENSNNDNENNTEQDNIPNSKTISNGVDRNQNKGTEIRRRTGIHAERQANIEKKVNEIKRKQREIEAETDASKKRRRLQNH